ncbi:MAG TPA: helix-turn-helix transcriptional regulator [Verrucomicrobiota bacterium]|nr:helix-turn-helix transcriptional regulator [Verrucomicrobiota bacterium]HNS70366.1 helix-turn-helix transcriptional regulator [Verrucomicrobiota bacterium]
MAKSEREIIGKAVLRYRRRAGLSQEALAEKADIHPNYVGRIERGECSATITILLRIAKALGVRPYKLFLKL